MKKREKLFGLGVAVLLSTPLQAESQFDQMETFREIHRLLYVEGEKEEATALARSLREQLDKDSELHEDLRELMSSVSSNDEQFPLEKAIKYATGKKKEIYCKAKGLVYIEATHNDNTVSTVKLISSNRMANDSYSQITGGDWVYEVDTGYRDPVTSESWVIEASETSYNIKELRMREEGKFDKGLWRSRWKDDSRSSSYSSSGHVEEPLPIFLGNDFHLWGAWDLGFKIDFKVGYKEEFSSKETGASKDIILKTKRAVSAKLPKFVFQDSTGKRFEYLDCYEVSLDIQLDRLGETN